MGTYLPGTRTLDWMPVVGLGLLAPKSPPKYLSTTHGCKTSLLRVYTLPTSLDGCGFFNSVVVRLLFNLISAGSDGCFIILLQF